MGISFGSALGFGGSGFVDGMTEYEKSQQRQLQNEESQRALDSQSAYGNALTGGSSGAQPWDQQQNSLWQRIAGIFGAGQQPQGQNPMGASALPPGVMPVTPGSPGQDQNMFEQVAPMIGQAMTPPDVRGQAPVGPSAMPVQQMPQAQGPSPQAGPSQTSMAQMQPGQMRLEDIAARVRAANPTAPPHVLAAAVDRFRPWMNDEARLQNQMLQNELRVQAENRRGEQGNERLTQGNRRLDQGDQRLQTQEAQGNQRIAIGERNAGTRERAVENNQDYRTARLGQLGEQIQMQRQKMDSVDTRFQQRMEQARSTTDRAAAIREYEQAWREYNQLAGRLIQADATMTGETKKQMVATLQKEREQALAKVDQYRGGGTPYKPLSAPQPRAGGATLSDPNQPVPVEADATAGRLWRSQPVQQILREQNAGPKSTERAAPMTPQAQPPAAAPAAAPPPAAMPLLKEGVWVTLSNGETWGLRNGQPIRKP